MFARPIAHDPNERQENKRFSQQGKARFEAGRFIGFLFLNRDVYKRQVELSQLFTDDYGRLQALTREITRQLKDEILVTPRVKLVPKGALPKSEGKAVRVKDLRKTF